MPQAKTPLPSAPALRALPAPASTAGAAVPARPRGSVYVLAILVLLLSAGLGYLAGTADKRGEPRELMREAFSAVAEADADVRGVDEVVALGLEADPSAVRVAIARVPRGRARLLAALDGIEHAQRGLKGRDLQRARALSKAARGRLEMLRSAGLLLPLQARGVKALAEAEGGWSAVRRAGALADEAATAFNTHTASGVATSTELTIRAESELAAADKELRAAGRTLPEAKLADVLAYVEGKRRSAGASRRIDEVWLSGDIEEANRRVAERATQDGPLDALMPALPAPDTAIRTAYAELTADVAEDYAIGERQALEGDEALRQLTVAQPSE